MKLIRKIVSFLLIVAMILGCLPGMEKEAKAATASAQLTNLGNKGTLSVGSKTKTGNWWYICIGSKPAFCLDLGYTCHSGDTYRSNSATYTSTQSGKKGLKACVGYWYAVTKGKSRKAWVFAQALFWAIEEGDTSESELKAVLKTIKSNTGYYDSVTAAQMYSNIFEPDDVVQATVEEWSYSGSGSHRQTLLTVEGNVINYNSVQTTGYYRQAICLQKEDEDGQKMTGAEFTIEANNIDELYSYAVNGDNSTVDEDIEDFTLSLKTNENGVIKVRFTYHLTTNEYFYVSDNDLADMDSAAKKSLKEEWDEMGYNYASDLSKSGAEKKMQTDLDSQWTSIKNKYTITETSSGDSNIAVNPDYARGKTLTLEQNYSWTNGLSVSVDKLEWSEVIENPYELEIVDNYKKASIQVKKKDAESNDGKAHGNATLKGAIYQLYEDAACTKAAMVYDSSGNTITADTYVTDENGLFSTDYLRSGQTYYLKELEASEGYLVNEEVIEITPDCSSYTVEFTPKAETVETEETPMKGKIAIQKYYGDGETGDIYPESGTTFRIWLISKGSYEACDKYERDEIVTDEDGYAVSGELWYGKYQIEQVDTGGVDVEMIEPDIVKKEEFIQNGGLVTRTFRKYNKEYSAYLKIIKKDGNTEATVLKPGTSYQIYAVDEGGNESLVTQSYSNGNSWISKDTFTADESGQIMTYNSLPSGTYRIYEVDAATGYYIAASYIDVVIRSSADNYTIETKADGSTYCVVTAEYINLEAAGRLAISKTGEVLSGYEDGKFIYKEQSLSGAVFKVYADGDIETQDNQGTYWFRDGDLVATITTGEGADFTTKCGGITSYTVDENGVVTINLPLGKYRVEEAQTPYGYVLPDTSWKVEFTWENKDTPFVLNSTSATDGNGLLNVFNERAKAAIALAKVDADRETAISDALFGIYTKDAIYNADGKKIVEAGERIGQLLTGADGKATSTVDFPLMSEGYESAVSGSAVEIEENTKKNSTGRSSKESEETRTKSASTPDFTMKSMFSLLLEDSLAEEEEDGTGEKITLNSGDYYLKEEMVSDSYYLDGTEIPLHFEYADQKTAIVKQTVTAENQQTKVEIDKRSLADSSEIDGASLQITDINGNVIAAWTSGKADSVEVSELLTGLGYVDVTTSFDDQGDLILRGLLHDTPYCLTEIRPADGFVTAETITFMIRQNASENGSIVSILQEDGSYADTDRDIVTMFDDTTKVQISKTDVTGEDEVPGCDLEITDKDSGEVIDSWTSTEETHYVENVFVVGKTYVLTEIRPADGYTTAASIEFTIQDTGEIQKCQMKDKQTRIRFRKETTSGKLLKGAKITVYDSDGRKVTSFTTKGKKAVDLTGVLAVGKTYTFKEVKTPKGYETAKAVKLKVKDTAKVQVVKMVDEKSGTIVTAMPSGTDSGSSPKTGYGMVVLWLFALTLVSGTGGVMAWKKWKPKLMSSRTESNAKGKGCV